jgi:hypothetical protein
LPDQLKENSSPQAHVLLGGDYYAHPKAACIRVDFAFVAAPPSGGHARTTGLIFVSGEQTNSLVILNPETNRIVKHLKTSRGPRDMHFNTDHTYLYVACAGDDAIDIIDVAKLEVVGRFLIIDREKFTVAGKIELSPPGVRQDRRNAD